MGSDVKFIDHDLERVRHVRLVFPEEADNKRCVSIMSSLGSALIGLGPGQSICWSGDQNFHKLTVLEVGVGENKLSKFRAERAMLRPSKAEDHLTEIRKPGAPARPT
jgi:hypothetical protein